MSNKPQVIEKQIIPLVTEASTLKITSHEDMEIATIILSKLNDMVEAIKEEKNKVLDPLNLAREAEIARWKPALDMYEKAVKALRPQIALFQTEQVKAQREEEKRIAERIGAGKGHYTLATAVKKIGEMEKPLESVKTSFGSIKFREVKKFRIVDRSKIPQEYLTVDEAVVKEAMKNGKPIEGIEYYTEQQPVNYR